jgi:amidohydrolase
MLPSLQKSAGKDNVILVPAETGSEDFSFFAEKVPGLYFYIGGLSKGERQQKLQRHIIHRNFSLMKVDLRQV